MTETVLERETRLMHENMGLVVSLAKKFYPKTEEEFEDFKQIGAIGLLKAIRTQKDEKACLSTWAYQRIRWEIIRHINAIKCPDSASLSDIAEPILPTKEQCSELLPSNLSEDELQVFFLRRASYNLREISEIMGISSGSVARLMKQAVQKIKEVNE